jgi:antitoxin component of MazEF toxin-antitoxin module
MDLRNVQKTGNMHYVYLPTKWCKQHKLSGQSKVLVGINEDGTLTISSHAKKKKKQELILHIKEDDLAIIHKLIIASYLAPTAGFRIELGKNIDYTKLLDQKKLISLELVELNKHSITCESSMIVEDLGALMKTMLRKIRNMLVVMMKNYHKELVSRYEEEIDRSQLLLEKSIIESFTLHHGGQLRTVELHYVSLIAKELERLVDLLNVMGKRDIRFLESVLTVVDSLKDILSRLGTKEFSISHEVALIFIKTVDAVDNVQVKDIATYEKKRIREHLVNVSELLIDWSLLYQLDGVLR